MPRPPVQLLNPTIDGLRRLLAHRGLTEETLASGCGLAAASVRWQIGSSKPRPRWAWKIERFLGVAIWTEQGRFTDLVRASDFLGTDFILTKFHPLLRAAVAKGVRGTRRLTNKDALLARVLAHLAETQTHASK